MIRRAYSATFRIKSGENALNPAAIHHIGFTIIALSEGFIIVALLNLRINGSIVGVVAIAVVILGRRIIERLVARHRQRTLRVDSEEWSEGPIDHS